MSIQAALYYHLTNNAGVSALVVARVYPAGGVPSSADRPYLTYQKISNVHERHSGGGSGFAHPRIQVDCWADTLGGADELYEAVRSALDNYSGSMGEVGDTVSVSGVFLDGDTESFFPATDASEKGLYRVSMDFIIWHRE